MRREGSEQANEESKDFNVTVNAYDPVVHVYTGWGRVVNSAARDDYATATEWLTTFRSPSRSIPCSPLAFYLAENL